MLSLSVVPAQAPSFSFMQSIPLFPLADYWWFYALFTVGVIGLLGLDLGVFHRKAHDVSFKEALGWTVVWCVLAVSFCFGLWRYAEWKLPQDPRLVAAGLTAVEATGLARQTALEFLTGYVVELSLSVDNIFVFIVVFIVVTNFLRIFIITLLILTAIFPFIVNIIRVFVVVVSNNDRSTCKLQVFFSGIIQEEFVVG